MIKRFLIVIITPIFFLLAAHFIIPYTVLNNVDDVFGQYLLALLFISVVFLACLILYKITAELIEWIVNGK